MFRHLQKRQKLSKTQPGDFPTGGSDSDSDSDSDSHSGTDADEQSSDSQGSGEESQADSNSDEPHTQAQERAARAARIPASLLKVLENPIIYPGELENSENEDSESADSADDEELSCHKSAPNSRSPTKEFPVCLVCPGKLLKTNTLLEDHVRGQTHKRRLARYKDFIHNPPPHTSLSPDASEVIELIDALIGPPPVVQAGCVPLDRKQRRKKRRLAKRTRSAGKAVLPNPNTAGVKFPIPKSKEPDQPKNIKPDQTKNKPTEHERVRKGKRERQDKMAKSNHTEIL
ncbi:hypothetical protein VP01_3347g3 [Puccinia sorghi]|uniref:Uncharacterized protein n=1 Tax=Puccinia sorghi TaxID=27349 RepID=A0A0L6UXX5_9BASI|nr:hypothetical protein VP01_3347g3 [Puccinia sorghi]